MKLILDAIATASIEGLRFSAALAAFAIVFEAAICLLLREATPAFLRRAVTNYRMHAFAKLLDKGIGAFDQGGASVYESAFTNDITTIETNYLEKIETLARDIPMFLSAVSCSSWRACLWPPGPSSAPCCRFGSLSYPASAWLPTSRPSRTRWGTSSPQCMT